MSAPTGSTPWSVARTKPPSPPTWSTFANYFAWFGTPRRFETLTQTFVRTDEGAFNAHHYRYAPEMSTFIVECTAETFERCRLADMDEAQSARACEEIFAEVP